jgi:hypothetical protein
MRYTKDFKVHFFDISLQAQEKMKAYLREH